MPNTLEVELETLLEEIDTLDTRLDAIDPARWTAVEYALEDALDRLAERYRSLLAFYYSAPSPSWEG